MTKFERYDSAKEQYLQLGIDTDQAMEQLKTEGVVVTDVADLKPWQEAVKSVIEKYTNDFKEQLDVIAKLR